MRLNLRLNEATLRCQNGIEIHCRKPDGHPEVEIHREGITTMGVDEITVTWGDQGQVIVEIQEDDPSMVALLEEIFSDT